MEIEDFKLERYFAKYEFSTRHVLGASDCEGLSLKELLGMADEETLSLWEGLRLGYTESHGHPLFREEVAGLYKGIASDDVITLAPEEGIFIAMNVILRPGDHVVVTYPAYQSLYEVANAIGCKIARWMPNREEGWRFEVSDLMGILNANTKLIVVNFPHNPTGHLPSRGVWEEVLEVAADRRIRVFSDEMYRLLELDEGDRLPSACEVQESALVLSGMSKAFALAGLRSGWLITGDRALLGRLAAFKDYTTICSSAPSEILSIMALRAKRRILKRNLQLIMGNLAIFSGFAYRNRDRLSWVEPRAGTVAFPELKGIDADSFCSELVTKKGVLLVPASVFAYGGNNFRIGFGRKDFGAALGKVEEYLECCPYDQPARSGATKM